MFFSHVSPIQSCPVIPPAAISFYARVTLPLYRHNTHTCCCNHMSSPFLPPHSDTWPSLKRGFVFLSGSSFTLFHTQRKVINVMCFFFFLTTWKRSLFSLPHPFFRIHHQTLLLSLVSLSPHSSTASPSSTLLCHSCIIHSLHMLPFHDQVLSSLRFLFFTYCPLLMQVQHFRLSYARGSSNQQHVCAITQISQAADLIHAFPQKPSASSDYIPTCIRCAQSMQLTTSTTAAERCRSDLLGTGRRGKLR